MQSIQFAGIELDNCPFCNGCWLDKSEAGQMTRSRGKDRLTVELKSAQASDLSCPSCRKPEMQVGPHFQIPNLVLDQCKLCGGVWLDRGELTTLLSWRAEPG